MPLAKKILKWFVIAKLSILLFLSVFPYVLPLKEGESFMARRDYFSNSQIDEFDGVWVHYRVFEPIGTKKGNFLLIHGFAGSTFSWRKNVDFLQKEGYLVLCVDLPAYGYSDRLHSWNHSVENRASLLWKVAEKVSPESTWYIAGHSMGAGVALAMGQLQQAKTQKIFCINGLFSKSPNSFWSNLMVSYPPVQRWAEVLLQNYYGEKTKFKEILHSAYSQEPTDEDVEGYLAPMLVRGTAKAILHSFTASSKFDLDYQAVKSKVVVIWGERDTWIPFRFAQKWHEKYPEIPLESIKNAGHCPMETHPQELHLLWEKHLPLQN